ncbi:host specificity factor TipJ family phage tail protein [Ancylobacter sp. VNQ12]|uniref:host specificity factor TipJ family phage tail protein n=1 Tax=Ancylobacter sp. VNQ12 TaxID=3400920 RepID=UPI003C07F8EE
MTAAVLLPVLHIAAPGIELARAFPRRNETITGFLRRNGWSATRVPTICVIDGEPVMRRRWRTRRIRKTSMVEFHSLPMGGGTSGSSLIGLIGVIALTALAPWAGSALAGSLLAGTAYAGTALAGVAGGIITGAIVLGGSFLLSTLSKVEAGGSQDAATPIYSWARQTNSARPLQPMPCAYGRTKRTLDYAAVPWSSFDGDDQVVHVLLSEGEGRYSREQILIEDTALWTSAGGVSPNFSGVEVSFYEPEQEITAFPINVVTSSEVDGQELSYPSYVGGFAANAPDTTATHIYADILAPGGVYGVNDKGKMVGTWVGVRLEVRTIDAAGAPTGGWMEIASAVKLLASKSAVRFTIGAEVAAGRYEARVQRTLPASTDTKITDTVVWSGLRALITGPKAFPCSTIAIKAVATDQFSGDAISKISVVETRILPVWTGSGWVDQPTRSPAWAALDIATNATYGGRFALARVDFQAFVDLAARCAARGDTFNYDFTSTQPVTEALDTALGVCRAKHKWLGGTLSLVRDEPVAIPTMMLTDNEIVRGSLEIEYLLKATEASQCVVLEYIDESTWQLAEAVAPRDATEEMIADATRLQLPGLVARAQAQREAEFLLRQNLYRRQTVKLETEHDGRMLSVGSTVLLQSELPQEWGQAGKVVRNVGTALVLDRPLTWDAGQHYVVLRTPRGKAFGPIKCARGASDSIAILDGADLAAVEAAQSTTLALVLERSQGGILPSFSFGLGTTWIKRCVVKSGSPSGDRVAIDLFVDDARVHDEDLTDPPPLPDGTGLFNPTYPFIAGLNARFLANEFPTKLEASWFPAANAITYVARVSYDEGQSYVPLGETRLPKLSALVEPVALWLEVAGIHPSGKQGAWSRRELATPVISADNVAWDLENFQQGLRDLVGREIIDQARTVKKLLDDLAMLMAEQDSANYLDKQTILREVKSATGRITAAYREEITVATGPDSALAQAITELNAAVDDLDASVTTRIEAAVGPGSAIALAITNLQTAVGSIEASFSVRYIAASLPSGAVAGFGFQAKVTDGVYTSQAGMNIYAFGTPGNYRSEVWFEADRFAIGKQGAAGYVAPFIWQSGTIYMRGDMYLDGSITAQKLSVANLAAIQADMGTIRAGRLLSYDGKVDINLTEGYEYWSGV